MTTEITTIPSPLALVHSTALVPNWRWRSRDGEMNFPKDMETRHLFHTLRMIWNNFMPAHMRVGQRVQLYRFNKRFYPGWYLAEAIVHCWNELGQRDDLTAQWQRELDEMAGHFKTKLADTGPLMLTHEVK